MKNVGTEMIDQKTYFGGKSGQGTFQTIINHIPQHKTFLAGFIGGGGIVKNIRPAKYTIGIDLDPAVVRHWTLQASLKIAMIAGSFLDLDLPCFDDPETFIYLDPPYRHNSLSSSNRYKHTLSDNQHLQLLSKINAIGSMVAISTYDNEMYQEHLKSWNKIQFESTTHAGQKTETLYMNYLPPVESNLHDSSFVGTDYRQRERLKRKCNTIIKNINRLSGNEKAYLLQRLQSETSGLIS